MAKAYDEGRKKDGKFYLEMDGELEEVTEEVYRAYLQFTWREKKVQQKESGDDSILSLDQMFEENSYEPEYFGRKSVEDQVIMEYEVAALHEAVDGLQNKDRALIEARFFEEPITEQKLAEKLGVSQQMVSKNLKRIYGILHEEMKGWED